MRTALAEHDGILSLGGGAITSEGVREALTGHTVIYLEISAAEGIRRTTGGTVRPLLAGDDPAKRYRELMVARVPLYRRVATMRINTNRHNPCCGAFHRQQAREPRRTWSTAASASAGVAPRTVVADPCTDHRGAAIAGDRRSPQPEGQP